MPTTNTSVDGAKLRRLRERRKMTQVDLAIAARTSPTTVAAIEQGQTPDPRGSTLRALATALGVAIEDLLQ